MLTLFFVAGLLLFLLLVLLYLLLLAIRQNEYRSLSFDHLVKFEGKVLVVLYFVLCANKKTAGNFKRRKRLANEKLLTNPKKILRVIQVL